MTNEALLRQLLGDEAVDRLLVESPEDPILAGDSAWLRDLIKARKTLPLPAVQPLVSQDLKDLFDRQLLIEHYEGTLVADSRDVRELAGVRGSTNSESSWTLSYSCEAADIIIDVVPTGAGTVDIDGQVMSHGSGALAYRAAVSGPTAFTTTSDDLGCFRIPQLPLARYDLVLSNRRVEIQIALDLQPDS